MNVLSAFAIAAGVMLVGGVAFVAHQAANGTPQDSVTEFENYGHE